LITAVLALLLLLLQYLIVKELFMMARVAQKDRKVPGFRAQQWYFFFVAAFYLYLRYGSSSRREAGRQSCGRQQAASGKQSSTKQYLKWGSSSRTAGRQPPEFEQQQ
jgi:hypothetical protein